MDQRDEDGAIAYPEVVTLHWEGPARLATAGESGFGDASEEIEAARCAERERELVEMRRTETGQALWEQIEREAATRGDAALWQRKLHAYGWVKLYARGSAGDYARLNGVNHATVRSWISDVAKLAYQVGYRLHEDRLLLVGEASPGLARLRRLVNQAAASPETWQALRDAATEFRGEDPYFHLNEGHVLRALARLRESDATLATGLTIADAHPVRALLWNARGQTFWDCRPDSDFPLPDHLARAEKCFRRAAALDSSSYFPYVNLAQLAVDAGDTKRTEYWLAELATARTHMDANMKADLVDYLEQAEWAGRVEGMRCWRIGPGKWLREAGRRGLLALLAVVAVTLAATQPSAALDDGAQVAEPVAHGGDSRDSQRNDSGAGGN